MFNENIGMFGAWDSSACTTVITNQLQTICECSDFGVYAVEAEIIDPSEYVLGVFEKIFNIKLFYFTFIRYGVVFTWINVVKYMGYFFSLISMVVFFLIIIFSSELWDQFHILRCHTSFACFASLFSMMVS